VFNLDLAADVHKAAASDDLADAINYAAVTETISAVVRDGKFRLIETVAERVAERLMAEYGISWLRLEVIKPRDGFSAAVTIERPAAENIAQEARAAPERETPGPPDSWL
jgi:7,8-dihydroneopterin aldolase/epimerase/oxygenase